MRIVVSHVTFGCGPTYARGTMASKKQNKATKKKEFTWTEDEAELLLNVTHDYKIKHLTDGTCWESVRSKYADILELYQKELPRNDEEARATLKDYRHKADQITKKILTAKLKSIRTNYRKVCTIHVNILLLLIIFLL